MVCDGDISETLYDPRLLLWVVMGWADCTRGDLEHSYLLNSCSTWVDEVGRNSLAGVHEDPIATSTSPRRKRVICKPYKPSNHDGVVSHKAGGLASRGLSGPYIKFFVNGMEGCSSSLKSCRSQRADMGAYFLILRLAHRGVVHDDELFPTVFAGSTSCVDHPEINGSRNIGHPLAIWAGEHGRVRDCRKTPKRKLFTIGHSLFQSRESGFAAFQPLFAIIWPL